MDASVLDEKAQKSTAATLEKEKEDKNILNALPTASVKEIEGYEGQLGEAEPLPNSYIRFMERSGEELDGKIHFSFVQCYDMSRVKILLIIAVLFSINNNN